MTSAVVIRYPYPLLGSVSSGYGLFMLSVSSAYGLFGLPSLFGDSSFLGSLMESCIESFDVLFTNLFDSLLTLLRSHYPPL